MNSNKTTRSRQRHGDRAPGSRGQSRPPFTHEGTRKERWKENVRLERSIKTPPDTRRHEEREVERERQAREVNQDTPRHTKKRGKRGGKRTLVPAGLRRNMTKSERLSRKYFRICSWNCASVSRRGAVLEILVYDFDVICLQETRTHPEKATRTE